MLVEGTGVIDLMHVLMSFVRNSGGPASDLLALNQVGFNEACERRLDIYVSRESDSFIVVKKPANKVRG